MQITTIDLSLLKIYNIEEVPDYFNGTVSIDIIHNSGISKIVISEEQRKQWQEVFVKTQPSGSIGTALGPEPGM